MRYNTNRCCRNSDIQIRTFVFTSTRFVGIIAILLAWYTCHKLHPFCIKFGHIQLYSLRSDLCVINTTVFLFQFYLTAADEILLRYDSFFRITIRNWLLYFNNTFFHECASRTNNFAGTIAPAIMLLFTLKIIAEFEYKIMNDVLCSYVVQMNDVFNTMKNIRCHKLAGSMTYNII